jgi:hypothetical protein
MGDEATGAKLGRFVSRARNKSSETSLGLRSKARFVLGRPDTNDSPVSGHSQDPMGESARDVAIGDSGILAVEVVDALARAEAAEAENVRLRAELARKEEILTEAQIALRTARHALRDQLRITQQ